MGCQGSKPASVDTQQQPPKAAAVATVKEEQVIPVPKVTCQITLEKDSDAEEFGTTVIFPDKTSLLIKAFTGKGTVVSHNSKNESTPDAQVRLGDCIVEVNGVSGDKDKMLAEIKKSTTLALIVKRDGAALSADVATTGLVPPADAAATGLVPPADAAATGGENEVAPEQKAEPAEEKNVEPALEQKVEPVPEQNFEEANPTKVTPGALEVEIVDKVADKAVQDMQVAAAARGEASPDEMFLDVPTFEESVLPVVVKDKEEGAVPNRGCFGVDNWFC